MACLTYFLSKLMFITYSSPHIIRKLEFSDYKSIYLQSTTIKWFLLIGNNTLLFTRSLKAASITVLHCILAVLYNAFSLGLNSLVAVDYVNLTHYPWLTEAWVSHLTQFSSFTQPQKLTIQAGFIQLIRLKVAGWFVIVSYKFSHHKPQQLCLVYLNKEIYTTRTTTIGTISLYILSDKYNFIRKRIEKHSLKKGIR